MSELRPCPACQRHAAIEESSCPFCAAPLPAAEPRPRLRGRLSRAAVFAGAALAATAACGGGKPKTATNANGAPPVADAGVEPAPADAAEPLPPPEPDHMQPMPYGAPPARRRVV